jgi:hypothetical protein
MGCIKINKKNSSSIFKKNYINRKSGRKSKDFINDEKFRRLSNHCSVIKTALAGYKLITFMGSLLFFLLFEILSDV